MKALKKNGLGGGLVAALLVMAVLGLVSLTGCANTSEGASGPNLFLGEWEASVSGMKQTFEFTSNGTGRFIVSVPGYPQATSGFTFTYTARGDTAKLEVNGSPTIITLEPDGHSFVYGGAIYTKQ